MRIALVSLDQKWEDKAVNLQRFKLFVARAKSLDADLVIFPEMTLTGFSMKTSTIIEDAEQSPSIKVFSEMARLNQIGVVAGLALNNQQKAGNALVAFSKDGMEQARYFKIHPFSFSDENKFFQPGNKLSKMNMPEFKFGFSICYDLRFPELYSALAKESDVLVNIANWPKCRVAHWRILLQARAIENQTFVIGVNRIGVDGNGLEYERSSLIVNANGEFIKSTLTEGEMDIYEISRQELLDFRRSFSTRQDRVPDLYRAIL